MNEVISALQSFATSYGEFKDWLTQALSLSRDALHIHVGLGLFFLALLLLRGRAGDTRPWLVVLVLTLLAEVADYAVGADTGQPFDASVHLHDIWNSMLWPTVLTLWGRWRRRGSRR